MTVECVLLPVALATIITFESLVNLLGCCNLIPGVLSAAMISELLRLLETLLADFTFIGALRELLLTCMNLTLPNVSVKLSSMLIQVCSPLEH